MWLSSGQWDFSINNTWQLPEKLSFLKFIYFWPCRVFTAVRALLYSWCMGFSSQWLLLFQSTDFTAHGLNRRGLVAPWHVGSSWIRDRTHVSCTGRQILYQWATREAPEEFLKRQLWQLRIGTWRGCLPSTSSRIRSCAAAAADL